MVLDQRGGWLNEVRFLLQAAAYPLQLAVSSPTTAWAWVKESIETREQLELMRSLGTNEAQGYYLGRPTPNPMDLLGWGAAKARVKELEAVSSVAG